MTNYFWARDKDFRKTPEWLRVSDCGTFDFPRPAVFVNGTFDLLHTSHMRLLHHAAGKKGARGCLVVAMDGDQRVKALKGSARPIQSWVERATALSWMPIDYLVEFGSDAELAEIVAGVAPDLRVTGGDKLTDPGFWPGSPDLRTMLVQEHGVHTSELIERCRRTV
jgi:cytidyltransferase-like protein